jgi:hypothetical protein
MLLECNGHTVDEKKFPFGTDPNEMHVWLQEVMEEHEGSCPIEDEEVMDETETPVQDAIDAINKVINVHENHLYPKDAQAFTAALERLEGLKAANDDWK